MSETSRAARQPFPANEHERELERKWAKMSDAEMAAECTRLQVDTAIAKEEEKKAALRSVDPCSLACFFQNGPTQNEPKGAQKTSFG
jgi:hypothetical protein